MKEKKSSDLSKLFSVGATGFEPATSRPPAVRATKLRHTPVIFIIAELTENVKSNFQIF